MNPNFYIFAMISIVLLKTGCSAGWDGIDFMNAIDPGGYNVNASTCSSLAPNAIGLSSLSGGTNAAYGATYENDPNGILDWN